MSNIHLKILESMDGIVEYQRNLKNCVSFIEEAGNSEFEETLIKGINLEAFVKKNISLKEKFKKKNSTIKKGDTVMVRILKYYVKLNDQVVFVCDLDSDEFEIIQ